MALIKVGHMSGWRWIFILEGLITVLLSIAGYWLIVDFPEKNKFLTPEETSILRARIERDRADYEYDPITFAKCLKYTLDLKLWAYGVLFMCSTMPAYAYAYFFPVILKGIGFSTRDSQLLIAPAGAVACIYALLASKLADRLNKRGPFIAFQAGLALIGLLMTAYSKNNNVRYLGGFFGYAGAHSNIPTVLSYQSNNIRGQSKRAFGSAICVGMGGIGGILASTTYLQSEFPNYLTGIWVTMGLQITAMFVVAALSCWFTYRNRQVDRGVGHPVEGLVGFKYTL